jgi:hypothetical protein
LPDPNVDFLELSETASPLETVHRARGQPTIREGAYREDAARKFENLTARRRVRSSVLSVICCTRSREIPPRNSPKVLAYTRLRKRDGLGDGDEETSDPLASLKRPREMATGVNVEPHTPPKSTGVAVRQTSPPSVLNFPESPVVDAPSSSYASPCCRSQMRAKCTKLPPLTGWPRWNTNALHHSKLA